MTAQGLRKIVSGELNGSENTDSGRVLDRADWLDTGNPIGFVPDGELKIYGEENGTSKIETRAKRTAKEIGEQIKVRFQEMDWIN